MLLGRGLSSSAANQLAANSWIMLLSASHVVVGGNYVDVDTAGNIFVTLDGQGVPTYGGSSYLYKLTTAGSVSISNEFVANTTGYAISSAGMSIGPDDKIYFAFKEDTPAASTHGGTTIVLSRKDNDGSNYFARRLSNGSTGNVMTGSGIKSDSSANFIVAGYHQTGGLSYSRGFVVQVNSTGTIQWQKELYATSATTSITGMDVDSSDNIYVTGNYTYSGSIKKGFIAKYNSSGTLQWQVEFGDGVNSAYGTDVVCEAGGNIYVGGVDNGTRILLKVTSGGSLTWGIEVDYSSTRVATVAGGAYLGAYTTSPVNATFANLGSGGSLVWENAFKHDGALYKDYIFGLAANGDWLLGAGYEDYNTGATKTGLVAKMPRTGSFASTYGSTFTSSVPSTSTATWGLSLGSSSLNDGTSAFSIYNSAVAGPISTDLTPTVYSAD